MIEPGKGKLENEPPPKKKMSVLNYLLTTVIVKLHGYGILFYLRRGGGGGYEDNSTYSALGLPMGFLTFSTVGVVAFSLLLISSQKNRSECCVSLYILFSYT